MRNSQKGFTLIELLVVIAIIGILATIVISSLSSARDKANDAKVQAQLSGFRGAAEIYYSNEGGYSGGTVAAAANGACASATDSVYDDATADNYIDGMPSGSSTYCFHDGTTSAAAGDYLIVTTLPSDATAAWCVDSSGNSNQVTTASYDTLTEVAALSYACQ